MLSTIIASNSRHPEINQRAGKWASQRIFGTDDGFTDFASVTVLRGGVVVAVVVLHDYRPADGTIEISLAGSGYWQSRRVINTVMRACYDIAGCQTVVVKCAEDNTKTIENARGFGFHEVVIPNMRGRGINEHVFTLTDDAWKASKLYRPL